MRSYTAHLKPGRAPVLVREGWSWGAFLFGPVWLAAQLAWIPAVLHAAVLVLLTVAPGRVAVPLGVGLAVAAGVMGRDLVRWSLERRGYVEEHVLAARDADGALSRLLTVRPDVAAGLAGLLR